MSKHKIKKIDVLQNLWLKYYPLITALILLLSLVPIGYPTLSYLVSTPGAFDDFLAPFINANTKELLNPNILVDKDFNSPFSPVNIYFFQILGVFAFKPPYIFTLIVLMGITFLVAKQSYQYFQSHFSIYFICFSFPTIFVFSRGNMAIFVLFLLLVALNFLKQQKITQAACILGLMACFQLPYALFFSLLPIFVRNWVRPLFLSASVTAGLFLIPFSLYGFNASLSTFIELNKRWMNTYLNTDEGLLHGSSLYGMYKSLLYVTCKLGNIDVPTDLDFLNYLVIVTLIPILTLFLRNFSIAQWRQRFQDPKLSSSYLLIVAVLFVILPQVSAYYKGIFILPFILIYLNVVNEKLIAWLSILFIIPKDLIWFQFSWYGPGVTIASVVNPALLYLILLFTVKNMKNII